MSDSSKKDLHIVSVLTKQATTSVPAYVPKISPPDDVATLIKSRGITWQAMSPAYQNAVLWALGYVRSGSSYYKVYTKGNITMEDIQMTPEQLEQANCPVDTPCGQNKFRINTCPAMLSLITCAIDTSSAIPSVVKIPQASSSPAVVWGFMKSDDSKPNITVTSVVGSEDRIRYSIHINEATDTCGTGSVMTNTIPCFEYSSTMVNASDFSRPQLPNTIEILFKQIMSTNSTQGPDVTTLAPITAVAASSLSTGAIIGIVIGVLVLALIVFYFFYRRYVASNQKNDDVYIDPTYTNLSLVDINLENAKLGEQYPELANFQVDSAISLKRLDYTNVFLERLISSNDGYEVLAGRFDNTQVMVKRLAKNSRAPAHLITFASSVTIMATVSHPQMTTIVGVGWDLLENLCIITEATRHGTLRDALNQQGGSGSGARRKNAAESLWTWKNEKIALAMDIAKALVYLHTLEEPTAHGYLTSRDVFIVPGSESGIISAKVNSAALHSTPLLESTSQTSRVPTNFEWLAPEVLAGNPPSLASDIYAFGIILTELDTNAMPYSDMGSSRNRNSIGRNNQSNLVQRIMKDNLRPELSSSAPQPLIDVVNMCLEKDPLARPTAMVLVYHLRSKIKPVLG